MFPSFHNSSTVATIRPKGSGWEAMVRRKGHAAISRSFPKRVLAERWAREKESEIDARTYRDTRLAEKTPIKTLLDRYSSEITPTREPTSHVPEYSRLRTLAGYFGGYTAAGTASEHVVRYVRRRLETVGADAVRKELHLLSDVFDCARAMWGILVTNPVPDARRIIRKIRLLDPVRRRTRRLRDGEYNQIRDAPHKRFTVINKLALLCIETGMRRGELCDARREHLDFQRAVIHVPKSKTDWKTGKSGRTIPLSPIALEILKYLPVRIDGRLFGITPRSATQAFDRLCVGQQMEDLRLHDLRHEAISRWFEKGFSIPEVASMSGHEDWRSLKIYTHPDPEQLARRLSA